MNPNTNARGASDCERCVHLRRAPQEAHQTGCYHPDNMVAKQKAAYLNQQQIPGDHRVVNRDGDCEQFEVFTDRASLWTRLWG